MCGIAGILGRDGAPADPQLLRAMADAVVHRGPDGEGFYADGALGFAHRRLAVIDLSEAGHQPMATPDGRFVISYNGEVYNFRELRSELEALGHAFRSHTDTEVVLHAFAEWGVDSLARLNGMFAFSIWDTRRRELTLARDRYGMKPLYFTELGPAFAFSSEIKAFLVHPGFRPALDPDALVEYLTFQNLFRDGSLFRGVRMLPAGSSLALREGEDAPLEPRPFWDFEFEEPDDALAPEEYLDELDRLFQQAVSRQLVADVPVGAYLSGGMDSGSVTALAARQIENLRTFTVGFDLHSASGIELAFDERSRSEHMSYLFGTEHYEMVLKAGDMERVMARLVWHLEEPRVGQSYPNYYAAGLAAKFATVVLSGGGGDELFGGYPWRYYRAAVNDDFEHYVDKYYAFWARLLPNEELSALCTPVASGLDGTSTRDMLSAIVRRSHSALERPEDYINNSLYLEAKTFLHGLLVVEDKLSMAHSLETRLPFLDNDLVDFAVRVPVGLKLGNLGEVVRLNENEPGPKTERFYERARDGKLLLRQAMSRYIPEVVTTREKQGFSPPDATWYRGESIDYVRRRLLDPEARLWHFLDHDTGTRLVSDHLEGRENRRLLIWSLLSLEQWCRTFLDGERPA